MNRKLIKAGDGDPRHGTANAYRNLGCRCQACATAGTERQREVRQRMVNKGLSADDFRHGQLATYANWGCRCDKCRTARRVYEQDMKARKLAFAAETAGTG